MKQFIEDLLNDPDTSEFGKYFQQNYAQRPEKWAYCYRKDLDINTNMYLESLHKKIKYHYFDGKHVERLDVAIDGLLKLDAGLVIKVAKCQFLQTEVDFLGHHISVNGIEPSKEKIKVIEDFKLPETVKDLRRYLGVINFYHRFIPNAAENQAVLNNYLKGKKSNDKNKIHWTEESVQAFENSKQQLCKATVLVHPSKNAHISLMVDASDNGIGAVLQQLEHGV
ncbi:hypothetical protein TNIN_490661 [Trichonephila inaurata madagascariensis]|uniref:RNA-directed DNA polymerase n=1 Tax=Trichonephila inaurata madagascariensis TaxID=2747483 RepID=A0A8X6IEF3_9ARAC|nr:hypothetical protein TNIN_490661 [Trichonephila inaurata madagascariensis]